MNCIAVSLSNVWHEQMVMLEYHSQTVAQTGNDITVPVHAMIWLLYRVSLVVLGGLGGYARETVVNHREPSLMAW